MNTAVRALPGRFSGAAAGSRVETSAPSASNFTVIVLVMSLLLSAFGVIYMKDYNRRLFIQYQQTQQMGQQAEVEWGKLLLEQSTWSTQARIQTMAQNQLGMVMPAPDHIVMVEEH